MASITADPNNPFLINRSGPSISESVTSGISTLAEARERSQALQASQQQAEAQLGLQREAAAESVRQFDVSSGLQERQVALAERQQPISTQNFGLDKVAGFKQMLKGKGVLNGYDSVISDLEQAANTPGVRNMEVYNRFKDNWSLYQKSTLQSLDKQLDKERDPIVASKIMQEMKTLANDTDGQMIDSMMPTVSREAQAIRAQQAADVAPSVSGLSTLGKLITEKATQSDPSVISNYDARIAKEIAQTGDSSGAITLSDLASDYRSLVSKIEGIRSGQDILTAALGEEKPVAINNLQAQADTIAQHFQSLGGNIAALGISEQAQTFNTAEDVKVAVDSGEITTEEGINILKTDFGFGD